MKETMLFVKLTQQHHFQDDINCIPKSKNCTPPVQCLNPFIDPCGILRVGGRLKNALLPYKMKDPMLLPRNSHLSYLLTDFII